MTKTGKLKKLGSAAAYVVVALLIVAVAVILFLNLSGRTVFIFGRSAMWVKTESMEPVIPEKSYILVREATGADVKVGDVIVFKSDDPALQGALNTHRVIAVENGGAEFVTQGDNNLARDKQTAKAGNVVGIYERNLPVMSFLGRFLSTPFGITVIVLLIFVMVVLTFLPDVLAAVRARSKKAQIDAIIQDEIDKLKSKDDTKSDTQDP